MNLTNLRVWMLKGACANTSVCRPEFDCVVIASGRQNDLGNSAEFNNALAITTLLLLKIMVSNVNSFHLVDFSG